METMMIMMFGWMTFCLLITLEIYVLLSAGVKVYLGIIEEHKVRISVIFWTYIILSPLLWVTKEVYDKV